jgi:hypothetical protein
MARGGFGAFPALYNRARGCHSEQQKPKEYRTDFIAKAVERELARRQAALAKGKKKRRDA